MLCTMVPTGIDASGLALPGLISARSPASIVSPARNRCGARMYDSSPSWYLISAMNALRFGSYSSRCTTASTPNLRRLKSIARYDCLCPPPRNRLVIWPWLLRPPEWFLPSVRPLTGLPFHRSERSISTVPRRLAVTGLKFLIGIAVLPRRSRQRVGEVDRLARFELDERLLHIGPHARPALELLGLALLHQRVHAQHLDAEQPLDRRLDLRLRGA